MIFNKLILFKLIGFTLLVWCQKNYTQNQESSLTAFKKGRWLTGLSGSINSTTASKGNADFKTTSNNFGINIETGKLVKDRFLLGGLFQTKY